MDHTHLLPVEHSIEHDLDKHDYNSAFKEVEDLYKQDPKHIKQDLTDINKQLHHDGYLPGLKIVELAAGQFDLRADGQAPPPQAPTHYNPPAGGWDQGGANAGSAGIGGGGYSGFGGDIGGGPALGSTEGNGLPVSGPHSFENYDGNQADESTDEEKISQAAAQDVGQSLWQGWAGTENGVEGCAASVSQLLDNLGEAHLSSAAGDALCSTMETHLLSQGWTVTSKPQPGDVVIGYGGLSSAHTGIVGNNNTVFDNHSSNGQWSKDNLSYFSNWNKVVFLTPPAAKRA